MTTITTAEAATQARVTTATIRTWARYGAITATKHHGRWHIDPASLRRRIAIAHRTVRAQLAQFRDPATARAKAEELIEQAAIIPATRRGLYLAISTDATTTYLVDVLEDSCTCKGHVYSGHCYHAVAAAMLETARTDLLALAA